MSLLHPPEAGEFGPFYSGYVEKAGSDPIGLLDRQSVRFRTLGGTLTEEQSAHRYAPEKWSVKQVIGHLIDSERIMSYRALRIARGDATPLAGFDENAYAAAAGSDRRSIADLLGEMTAIRAASIALFRSLDTEAFERVGMANAVPVSARAMVFITAGHTEHHLGVLADRYGIAIPD